MSSKRGIVSNRDAGAMAAPADAVPIDESTAGITHHQGSGRIGAISFSRGISILNGLSIRSRIGATSASGRVVRWPEFHNAFYGRIRIAVERLRTEPTQDDLVTIYDDALILPRVACLFGSGAESIGRSADDIIFPGDVSDQ